MYLHVMYLIIQPTYRYFYSKKYKNWKLLLIVWFKLLFRNRFLLLLIFYIFYRNSITLACYNKLYKILNMQYVASIWINLFLFIPSYLAVVDIRLNWNIELMCPCKGWILYIYIYYKAQLIWNFLKNITQA